MAVRAAWVGGILLLAPVTQFSGVAAGQAKDAKELSKPISPAVVKRVKDATVYLKVTLEGGRSLEGSGFFAVRPGVVITNAHVLGMLRPNSKTPSKIRIVAYSGESNELQLTGKVLGVDRASDIAVLHVEGKLPESLQFGSQDELFETQKVYIFGYPFGAELGNNITVSESSVSSLRKDSRGVLERIQVNGGMHPGNSGGPVVNSLGQVVGVSVAGIPTTQINFAIPATTARSMLDGRILDVKAGELYRKDAEVRVPLRFVIVDPFERIREIRLETWTGKPALRREYSPSKALAESGDGPRQTSTLKVNKDFGMTEVTLPKVSEGQVAWVQPVVVYSKGDPQWGEPQAFNPASALNHTTANLTCRLTGETERTVHLKASQSLIMVWGKNRFVSTNREELDILESIESSSKGKLIKTGFARPVLNREVDEKKGRVAADVATLLKRVAPTFVVDDTNRIRERLDGELHPELPAEMRHQVKDFLTKICDAYEGANFSVPNKEVSPGHTWQVQVPITVSTDRERTALDLALTCTYAGSREDARITEGVVTFEGELKGRAGQRSKVNGQVTGKYTFDLKHGFISSVKMTILSDYSEPVGQIQVVHRFDTDLTRIIGNPNGLELPGEALVESVGTARKSDKDPFLHFQEKQFVELDRSQGMIDLNGTFTVESWIRWDGRNPEPQYLFGDETWDGMSDQIAVTKTSGWILRTNPRNASGRQSLNVTLASAKGKDDWYTVNTEERVYDPGTWQHVAVCKEKERLYVCWNGEIFSFDTSSYTFTPSPTNLFLGPRKYAFKDRMLFGDIRAFRVSSAALYTKPYAPPVRFEKDRATLADLDFKVKVDMKLIDLSGKDRHGQLNGVTWVAPPRR